MWKSRRTDDGEVEDCGQGVGRQLGHRQVIAQRQKDRLVRKVWHLHQHALCVR